MPGHASTLLASPLHGAHAAAGGRLVPFAGWEMPLDYGSILEEARTVRSSAGIFDVSHMGRAWIRGPRAAEELDHALGGSVLDQPVDRARYTLLLNERGTILDDLITYRTGPEEFFLVVNAANRESDLGVLRQRLAATPVEDVTRDGGGILALQGPDSFRMLAGLTGQGESFRPGFLDLARVEAPGLGTLLIARTGYTGEHGYELFPGPEQIQPVWEQLLAAGARPAGLGARDVLRLEAALPLYGHEISEETTPFEAGLRFALKGWKARDFVGAGALRAMAPPVRGLVGLTADKRVPRQGYALFQGDRPAGEVCSGLWSATLERPIATAYLEKGVEGPLRVRGRGRDFPVRLHPLPFVPHRNRD